MGFKRKRSTRGRRSRKRSSVKRRRFSASRKRRSFKYGRYVSLRAKGSVTSQFLWPLWRGTPYSGLAESESDSDYVDDDSQDEEELPAASDLKKLSLGASPVRSRGNSLPNFFEFAFGPHAKPVPGSLKVQCGCSSKQQRTTSLTPATLPSPSIRL